MAKRTWDRAIKNGLLAYVNRENYAYFYGAKGEVLTDEVMDRLWKEYPSYFSQYTLSEKKRIYNYSRGKIGYDCSGFTGYVCTGDKSYSTAQMENCNYVTTPPLGVAGSILYSTFNNTGRHCGIDIGYGYFLHMPKEMSTIELGRIADFNWEVSGESKFIDYTGATNR